MPRRGELLALSREHHAALVLARDAVSAAASEDATQVAALSRRVADYWANEMAAHFRHEEALLLRHHGALPEAVAFQLFDDHVALAIACTRARREGLDAASLRAFGERLAAHVRFEERECFDALQAAIDADAPAQVRK